MTKTTRTQVSKTSKGIKALLGCFREWTGRRVTVIEAGPEWVRAHYVGDIMNVVVVDLISGKVAGCEHPRYGGPAVMRRTASGSAFVILSRFMGQDMGIEIVIPAGSIDPVAVAVATDAALSGDKRKAAAALDQCGPYAGIAAALVEARAEDLRKGEAAATYA